MIVLGLESSCDDTAAAVLEDGRERSSVVASQDLVHAPFGGVVPELAARNHLDNIIPGIEAALERAGLELSDIDAVAATRGPGLLGCLLVALQTGKGIACGRGLPFIGVNHIEGHLLSTEIDEVLPRPFLGMVVSGGHSALYLAGADHGWSLLGATRDDAAGEAFDKAAKLLDLGYPGGRQIEALARGGNPQALPLPRPRVRGEEIALSFSGLKTALWHRLRERPDLPKADVAASFQCAVVETLVDAARRGLEKSRADCLVVTGGVSANGALREAMATLCREEGVRLVVPPIPRCTDNAAMIAYAGWRRLERGERDGFDVEPMPVWPLGERDG